MKKFKRHIQITVSYINVTYAVHIITSYSIVSVFGDFLSRFFFRPFFMSFFSLLNPFRYVQSSQYIERNTAAVTRIEKNW